MKLTLVIKFVAHMDQAIEFHREVLGLHPGMLTQHWTEFETGDTRLALHPATDASPAGTVQLGFASEDLDGLFRDREKIGLQFIEPPALRHGVKLATAIDTDGSHFKIRG